MIEVGNNLKCVNDKPLGTNTVGPAVAVDQSYNAQEVFTCGCGRQHINVGLPLILNYVTCYDCHEELPDTNHWCHPSRFEVIG